MQCRPASGTRRSLGLADRTPSGHRAFCELLATVEGEPDDAMASLYPLMSAGATSSGNMAATSFHLCRWIAGLFRISTGA